MKTRIVLGMTLLATLLAVPLIVEAQSSLVEDAQKLESKLREERNKLTEAHGIVDEEYRKLAAREGQLKFELAQVAEKRSGFELARLELKAKIDGLTEQIRVVKLIPGAIVHGARVVPLRDPVDEKLDQIVNRLKAVETRLDRLEKSVKPK